MADRTQYISISGMNRILKSVRPDSLTTIDQDAFAKGLDRCIELYEDAKKYHTQKLEASQQRQLEIALNRAQRLQQLMKDEKVWEDDLWRRRCDSAEPSETPPRVAIQSIIRLVRGELDDRQGSLGYYRGTLTLRSPFEWLFGDWLPVVYAAAHFPNSESLKDLVSKNGPYIRFSKAVAGELKIRKLGRPYATASFIKAIKNAASSRISRRIRWYEPYLLPGEGNAGFFEQGPQALRDHLRLVIASPRKTWAELK